MKLQKLQAKLREVEKEVASLESEIAQHDAALADFKSMEETVRLSEIVAERRRAVRGESREWERVSGELEERLTVQFDIIRSLRLTRMPVLPRPLWAIRLKGGRKIHLTEPNEPDGGPF